MLIVFLFERELLLNTMSITNNEVQSMSKLPSTVVDKMPSDRSIINLKLKVVIVKPTVSIKTHTLDGFVVNLKSKALPTY